jgi:hypothetical protein
MRRVVLVTLLALTLPVVAFAGNISIVNSGGTLAGSASGMSLTNSTLIDYGGIVGPNLGTLSFSTGALTSGSLKMGGTFAGGGSFTIMGNGKDGVPNGVIFSGTFSGPVSWTLVTLANGTHNYTLSGAVAGNNGSNAATIQFTINTGKGYFHSKARISSGDTNISTTPELGTLGLLGTGLIGMAGLIRRRLSSSR